MKMELLPESGRFYKVNMHCHTDISDGKCTPEQVKEMYKSRGYNAVCFTDHEVLVSHKELCDAEFIALHGFEVAVKKSLKEHTGWFMPVYHFNMIAKDQNNLLVPKYFRDNPFFPGNAKKWSEAHAQYAEEIDATVYDAEWINDYLKSMREGGFLINYNHPQWSMHNACDYMNLKYLHSIEAINGACRTMNDNTSIHYEQLLRFGRRVVPTGGDDMHHSGHVMQAWTMIKADELTYEALVKAYERGDCYASEGPEILGLVIEEGKIVVNTSPAVGIFLYSEGRYMDCVTFKTETYTEARFDYCPEKMGKFFRIEVKDAAGNKAFSNAYYTDEIRERMK